MALENSAATKSIDEKLAALLEKCNVIADIQQGMTLLDVHLMNGQAAPDERPCNSTFGRSRAIAGWPAIGP
jgi:hypothetical protein